MAENPHSELAAALAFELGNHIDDLVDDNDTAIDHPDAGGDAAGHVMDTVVGDTPQEFFVLTVEGRMLKVTVTEVLK